MSHPSGNPKPRHDTPLMLTVKFVLATIIAVVAGTCIGLARNAAPNGDVFALIAFMLLGIAAWIGFSRSARGSTAAISTGLLVLLLGYGAAYVIGSLVGLR